MSGDERAELEAARREAAALREELEETNRGVVALTAELAARTRALEAADRRKDRFLALLGHELRNPLAVIDLVVDDVSPQERAQLLRRQIDHVRRLIDDLLDVSRVERGKITLDLRPVDLAEVVDTTLEDAREVLEKRGHQIEWTPPSDSVVVVGDPARLSQVVTNLLDNAVKYSPPGVVEVGLDVADEWVALWVRDEGRGVDPEEREHVFEPFAQTADTTDSALGGLGIGLTLVRSLVELHAGRTWLESAGRGCGTTFFVELPRAPQDDAPRESVRPRPARTLEGLRVLLVEDGDELRELLAARLRRCGLQVATAADGTEGLEVFGAGEEVDVVVTDLGLPGIDGYEVARRVHGIDPSVRLVALSGYGAPSDRQRTAEAGFHAHLVKPVALDALLGALKGDAPT